MTQRQPSYHERLAGGIVGLLVGDALGVPYEFHRAADIPPASLIDFAPPLHFPRSHLAVPPGTWSDDGAQALCLLASLLGRGSLDLHDFGARLLAWYEEGYMAVDGVVFDVGVSTGSAIRALRCGTPADQAGPCGQYDNGNGSLMRALPLALWHRGSDASLVRDAHRQSLPTHGHLRSQVCCALYCLWARRELSASSDPWRDAVAALRTIYASMPEALEELEWAVRPDDPSGGSGSGYVVDSLRSARMVQVAGTYEDVVRAAVSLGNDTDTTACIAGGIAGVRVGIHGIPARWREQLRGGNLYGPLVDALLACRTVESG
ncbi:ADP-ribosylglycohydrolase family protein [Massilia antarctica]|uniref:ADP-ribosylglycohydrolase family protein n=1 Tax=Massilia antarctica TaxID=2765360 RepID=UPI0006BB98E1|nr:ADP-ribosylglycohydrolase family protein [Massilia sp. H27-R4]CUI03140.1 similar to ADP-ribosylglycohydrolase [Janthinobacterium sp. CG23_2]CUU26926.1 similar to ADP-ribosylglycohydrolase [Janthinobacterium sp. CG23_2]